MGPVNIWWGWWDRTTRRWGTNLAWLEPDRLVYGLTDDRVSPIETTLYVVDDASTATDFAGAPVFERLVGGYILDLAATPDGRRMVYRRNQAHDDIWVVPLDDPESAAQVTHDEWDELPGISVFVKDENGAVFHTYSTYRRGVEAMMGAYSLMDLTPRGRDEAEGDGMAWVRHHDRYEPQPKAASGGCCHAKA